MTTITITHTHEDGTILTGSSKGDGVYEIVRKHGFIWRRSMGIRIPNSKDSNAKTWKINPAKADLEAAGHTVPVDIDNTPRPTEVVEAERAERADARADRYAERSVKAAAAGDARLSAARAITDGIPFGQPRQHPSHHSYRKHTNDLNKADNHRGKAVEQWRKADHLAGRAKGAIANQKHREDPRTTMRRVEKLEAEKRDINRKLEGYKRNFKDGKGKVVYVETHEPATGEWREQLLTRLAQVEEQITHWRGQLDAKAESGEFVAWAAEHFTKGDWVNVQGRWCEVARVNRKSVSVRARYDWQTSEHTEPVTWDDISGRRRGGMQWDTPNGEPWPVELARKVARWRNLQQWMGASHDYNDETTRKQIHIKSAQRIALGLDTQASDAEVEAYLATVADEETSRQVRAAFVDIYDRLAAGEKVPEVQATTTPLDITPEWRMPDREPEDRIAARSIFARHEFSAVQAGDLIVGWYDGGKGQRLIRSFCGPVAKVGGVVDRRERGEFIDITLDGGEPHTFKTHQWFAVHPSGTWETDVPDAEAEGGEQVMDAATERKPVPDTVLMMAELIEDAALDKYNARLAANEAERAAAAAGTGAEAAAVDVDEPAPVADVTPEPPAVIPDDPDPWGDVLDELLAATPAR